MLKKSAKNEQDRILIDMYSAELILQYYHINKNRVIKDKYIYDAYLSNIYEDIGVIRYSIQLNEIIKKLDNNFDAEDDNTFLPINIKCYTDKYIIADIFKSEMLAPEYVNEIYTELFTNIDRYEQLYRTIKYIMKYICNLYGIAADDKLFTDSYDENYDAITTIFGSIEKLSNEFNKFNIIDKFN